MKRNQQPGIRALWAEKDWSPIFQARLAISVYFIRNTRLDQLHRNDPWLLPTPIRLHPQSYRTLRETINVAPTIQECICKQTQAPADIIYKIPWEVTDNRRNPFVLRPHAPGSVWRVGLSSYTAIWIPDSLSLSLEGPSACLSVYSSTNVRSHTSTPVLKQRLWIIVSSCSYLNLNCYGWAQIPAPITCCHVTRIQLRQNRNIIIITEELDDSRPFV